MLGLVCTRTGLPVVQLHSSPAFRIQLCLMPSWEFFASLQKQAGIFQAQSRNPSNIQITPEPQQNM